MLRPLGALGVQGGLPQGTRRPPVGAGLARDSAIPRKAGSHRRSNYLLGKFSARLSTASAAS